MTKNSFEVPRFPYHTVFFVWLITKRKPHHFLCVKFGNADELENSLITFFIKLAVGGIA